MFLNAFADSALAVNLKACNYFRMYLLLLIKPSHTALPLQVYLNAFADSALAVNLKACNSFRMYNGKAAENELRSLAELSNGSYLENDLIRHNLVVFRGGENAMQVGKCQLGLEG